MPEVRQRDNEIVMATVELPFVPCPELPSSLQAIASPQRVHFNGNFALQGCPLFAGWRFRIGRYTTKQERKALRDLGWNFSGGW